MSEKKVRESKSSGLRQSRFPSETSKHRVTAPRGTVGDDPVRDKGGELPSPTKSRVVRSTSIFVDEEAKEVNEIDDDSEVAAKRSYAPGNRSRRTGVSSAASSSSPKVYGAPRAIPAPNFTCRGPETGVPCLSCQWVQRYLLEQSSCLMVQLESSDSESEATSDTSDVDQSDGGSGEDGDD